KRQEHAASTGSMQHRISSAALAVAAGQAGQTAVHLYRRLGVALATQLCTGRIVFGTVIAFGVGLALGSAAGELGTLLFQIGALVLIHFVLDQADVLEMLFEHIADL